MEASVVSWRPPGRLADHFAAASAYELGRHVKALLGCLVRSAVKVLWVPRGRRDATVLAAA